MVWVMPLVLAMSLLLVSIEGKYPHIMYIGDSVDRNSVMDWCESDKTRILCLGPHPDHRYRPQMSPASLCNKQLQSRYESGSTLSFHEVLKPFYHGEITVCYAKNLTVSFIFNKHGVSRSNFNCLFLPPKSLAVHSNYNLLAKYMEAVYSVAGRRADVVLTQSSFWDLCKISSCGNMTEFERPEGQEKREEWMNEWVHNNTALLDFIKSYTRFNPSDSVKSKDPSDYNGVKLLLWRTPTEVPLSSWAKLPWINNATQEILSNMTTIGSMIAKSRGFDIIDYRHFPKVNITRDGLHPFIEPSIAMTNLVISKLLMLNEAHSTNRTS